MKAAVLYNVHDPFVVEDLELGEPGPGETLIKMAGSGVCHSDEHVVDGSLPFPLPAVLGHEGAGVVEKVGPGVTYVVPGDHVILSFVPTCGKCHNCVSGRPNLCAGFRVTPGALPDGTRRMRKNGREINHFTMLSTYAEYTVVPEASLVRVREDAPLEKVCLIGCGVMTGVGAAINTAKVRPGSTCVIIGCGGVGLNVIQGCVLAGAGRIIAVDKLANKLGYAEQFGATHVIDASKGDVGSAVREINRFGADYAFEVIGRPETIEMAYELTARGGMAVVVGLAPAGSKITLSAPSFLSERALVGSLYGSTRQRVDMPMLADLYMAGKLKLDELITRTYPLDGINEAFEALRQGQVARGVIVFN